jgi:enamine deaminase RidA (YjgF/YER057c/UK114 family)
MPHETLTAPTVFNAPVPSSQAVLTPVGRMVHIAGQVAVDNEGQTIAVGDIVGQTEKAFDNIKALLASAGGSISDVCRLVIYVVNREDLGAIMDVRRRTFTAPFPATTAIVTELGKEDWLVEIEATAVLAD